MIRGFTFPAAVMACTLLLAVHAAPARAETPGELCDKLVREMAEKDAEIRRSGVYLNFTPLSGGTRSTRSMGGTRAGGSRSADDGSPKAYPIAARLKAELMAALGRAGVPTVNDYVPGSRTPVLTADWDVLETEVFLNCTLSKGAQSAWSGSGAIPRSAFDPALLRRGLNELIEELAFGLIDGRPSYFSRVTFLPAEMMKSGTSEVTEFGNTVMARLVNRLGRAGWTAVTDTAREAQKLSGEYSVGREQITISVRLAGGATAMTSATAMIEKNTVKEFRLDAPNPVVAQQVDQLDVETDRDRQRDQSLSGRMTTNKEREGDIYRVNDRMECTFIPDKDCYLHLYYLENGGKLYQVYPNRFSPTLRKLSAGVRYVIPPPDDPSELVFVEGSFGQEALIAFLSDRPLEPEVRRELISGLGIYELTNNDVGGLATAVRSLAAKMRARYNFIVKNIVVAEGAGASANDGTPEWDQ